MALHPLVRRILDLPFFLLTVFILFWSIPFTSLVGSLKFYQLGGFRNDNLGWSSGMKRIFKITVLKVGDRKLFRDSKTVYLMNHRSWADLIIDQYATAGRAAFLSRWAVAFVFPAFMGSLIVLKSVLMFKRGHIANKERFNSWIDSELAASPCTGLAVYPEGHRSTRREPLPLKRGMLHYAFSRKLRLQVVIGKNKEAVLSEKKMVARWGQTCAVGYSDVIDAGEYETFPEFLAKVQSVWDATWDEVFSAELTGLPELEPGLPDIKLSPFFMYMAPVLTTATNVIFAVLILGMVHLARSLFRFVGPLGPVSVSLGTILIVISFWLNSTPIDAMAEAKLATVKKQQRAVAAKLEAASNGLAQG